VYQCGVLYTVYMLQEYVALFRRLVGELPPDTARLRVYEVGKGGGTVVELRPTNPDAADLCVHLLDDTGEHVNFSFGRIATWELPFEGRHKKPDTAQLLAEVEQMCRAVIAGNCEERRGRFSITGRIYVGDYTYQVVEMFLLPIRGITTHRYAPYVSEGDCR